MHRTCYPKGMEGSAAKLLEKALALPDDARSRLAASLIESLEEPFDADIDSKWRAEVADRLRQLDDGSVETVDWLEARRLITGK